MMARKSNKHWWNADLVMLVFAIAGIIVLFLLGFETREISLEFLNRANVEQIQDNLNEISDQEEAVVEEDDTLVEDDTNETDEVAVDRETFLRAFRGILNEHFDANHYFQTSADFQDDLLVVHLKPLGEIARIIDEVRQNRQHLNQEQLDEIQASWEDTLNGLKSLSLQIYEDFGYENTIYVDNAQDAQAYLALILNGELMMNSLLD